MEEGTAKVCGSHLSQYKPDPEGERKVGWELLSLPYNIMKVPQDHGESSSQRQQ